MVPDRARLSQAGLRFSDVVQALQRNNRNDGAGRLEAGENTLIVRTEGALHTPQDLANVVLRAGQGGAPVRIGDVAEVRTEGLTRYGAVSRDGQGEAVQGIVVALRGADALHAGTRHPCALARAGAGLAARRWCRFTTAAASSSARWARWKAPCWKPPCWWWYCCCCSLGELRAALVVALMVPLAALGNPLC